MTSDLVNHYHRLLFAHSLNCSQRESPTSLTNDMRSFVIFGSLLAGILVSAEAKAHIAVNHWASGDCSGSESPLATDVYDE